MDRIAILSIRGVWILSVRPCTQHVLYSFIPFCSFTYLLFFFHHYIWVSRLSFPPPLFLLYVLTSHFLFPPVNINTGLMCTPVQMSALEGLTAHIVGHSNHILEYAFNPQAFSYPFGAQENDRQALWLFTFSETQCSVTSNHFWLRLLHAEVWVKFDTWHIAASYVTFEIQQDMSQSMNSVCEYGSSLLFVQFC